MSVASLSVYLLFTVVLWSGACDASPLLGFGVTTSAPTKEPQHLCCPPRVFIPKMQVAFLTAPCSWKTINPEEGDQEGCCAVGAVPTVPRPNPFREPFSLQACLSPDTSAAGVCVPCILSKHVTCSRSPGGSCRGSPVGLRQRCTSHLLADHGQGLAIYPVLGMQFHPLFFIDARQGRCLVGPTLQREKLCKCSGPGFGCRTGWTRHPGHLSNAGEIHGHRLTQPPGALPACRVGLQPPTCRVLAPSCGAWTSESLDCIRHPACSWPFVYFRPSSNPSVWPEPIPCPGWLPAPLTSRHCSWKEGRPSAACPAVYIWVRWH